MRLEWRNVYINEVMFSSSLTDREIAYLRKLSQRTKGEAPKILEIGTAYGYSACSMADAGANVFTIDPHQGYGAMAESLAMTVRNIQALGLGDRVVPIVGLSQRIMPALRDLGVKFDVVFVDGDHRYDAAVTDMSIGWGMLRSGGILAVHDYGEETCPEVQVAVREWVPSLSADDRPNLSGVIDSLWWARK